MSLTVNSNNQNINLYTQNTSTVNNQTSTIPTYNMPSDSVNFSVTATSPTPSSEPTLPEAGFFKKMGDSIGNFFSNVADTFKFGETYKLIESEFNQIDVNHDKRNRNWLEFSLGVLNFQDFKNADQNLDDKVDLKEFVKYRKKTLSQAFANKDTSGDNHINIGEIGSIGRILMQNNDPRLDANQDSLVNKREFMRANLRMGINIRDAFGF